MSENSAISWTDHTFNPWWGCWKIAPECLNCYADSTAARYSPGHWGRTAPRRFFGDKHWSEPRKWNRKAHRDGVRRRVFVGSMCDWAEVHPIVEIAEQMSAARRRLWTLIDECRDLDWLLLTKRPEGVARRDEQAMLPWMHPAAALDPWPHVWIGTTAGTIKAVRENIPILRSIPAAVRFVSCEPILEGISASDWRDALAATSGEGPIHWLIVGDESGHGARAADPSWIRTARDEAARYGVAFHFKQWCGADADGIDGRTAPRKKIHLPILDGVQHAAFPETP